MFGLGTNELLLILVIVFVIFGAGKLPQVGGALGKGLRNFKDGMHEAEEKDEEQKTLEEDNNNKDN
ncbi:MAG TPA: twin-arginine translocase TatA/TatE family subunit [Desulfuromonadales bacterium]|nr:twin-arginine translocase TatA/TatE family subunit [Desulfuromonadales bacterium]